MYETSANKCEQRTEQERHPRLGTCLVQCAYLFRNADYSQITTTSLERDTNVSSRHRQPSPLLKRCFHLEEFKNPATACKGFNPKQNDKLTLDTLASFDQGRFPAISQGSNVTRLMRTRKTFQPERKGENVARQTKLRL